MAIHYQYDHNGLIVVTDSTKPDQVSTFAKADAFGNPTLEWLAIEDDVASGEIVILPADPLPLRYGDEVPIQGMVHTTDAQPAEIYRLTLDSLTGYAGTVTVIGVDSGNGAVRVLRASFAVKRLNAGALIVGAPVVLASHADGGAATWSISPSVSGNDVVLNVTGAAGRTIDWGADGVVQSFAPGGVGAATGAATRAASDSHRRRR